MQGVDDREDRSVALEALAGLAALMAELPRGGSVEAAGMAALLYLIAEALRPQ